MNDRPTTATGSTIYTRIEHPRQLLLARIVWAAIVALALIVLLATLAIRMSTGGNRVFVSAATPEFLEQQAELTDTLLLVANILEVGSGALAVLLGIGIFLRRSNNWAAMVMSLALIVSIPNLLGPTIVLARVEPAWAIPAYTVWLLMMVFIYLFLFLFPDGHFYPPSTRWLLIVFLIFESVRLVLNILYREAVVMLVFGSIVLVGLSMTAQVARYRHRSTPSERQQTKWIVLGGIVFIALFALAMLSRTLVQYALFDTVAGMLISVLSYLFVALGSVTFTLSITLAILRYRLWDIDLALNRLLVYGAAFLLAAVIFFGGAVLLHATLADLHLALVLGAPAVIAVLLFGPVRRRAQQLIDHHLYKLRFNLIELDRGQKRPDVKNPGAFTGRMMGGCEVLGVIGRGGMGEVYKGYRDGQTVALKLLPADLARQPDSVERFAREAETTAQLDHPNIVRTYGAGESNGVHFMIMEFVEGQELKEYILEHGPLSPAQARGVLADVCAALDYAHAQGFVHRDIKPSNIMLLPNPDGETFTAKLMDFGVAKIRDEQSNLTGTSAIGTIDYMAPEQIHAARDVDHRADIYALGVVLYEMLTGERPFQGNPAQVLFAHLQQPPPDPRRARPDLPPIATMLVLQAMTKEPPLRFQSVNEMIAAWT